MNYTKIKTLALSLLAASLVSACSDDTASVVNFDSTVVTAADDFTDPRDGNTYHCIRIGNQIWMTENLRYMMPGNSLAGCYTWDEATADVEDAEVDDRTFRETATTVAQDPQYDGWPQYATAVATGTQNIVTMVNMMNYGYTQMEVMQYLEYYPDYYEVLLEALDNVKDSVKIGEDNYLAAEAENGGYVKTYGFLYSHDAAIKAVPDGWRLPSDDDFLTLERTLGLSANEAGLKEAWRGEGLATLLNEGGASGFNAKCAGGNTYIIKANGNNYMGKDENWYYWTSTMDKQKDSVDVAMIRMSAIYTNKVWRGTSPLTTGYRDVTYSVRCVKDVIKE